MTPVAHWSERDYFRARDRARRAWQAQDMQLEFGLDDPQDNSSWPPGRADGVLRIVEPQRLTSGAEPHRDLSRDAASPVAVPPASVPLTPGGSAPSTNTTRGDASLSGSRVAPREGA